MNGVGIRLPGTTTPHQVIHTSKKSQTITKAKRATQPQLAPTFLDIDLARHSIHLQGVDASTPIMREDPTRPRKLLLAMRGTWFLLVIFAASAGAEDGMRGSSWEGSYAGLLVGTGHLSNDIRDEDGFADWGNPGSTRGYDTSGAIGGVFADRRFELDGVDLRYEVEAMRGDLSAPISLTRPARTRKLPRNFAGPSRRGLVWRKRSAMSACSRSPDRHWLIS